MKRWLWLVPLLLAAIAYAPAPWGDLVWDDYFIEQQLPAFNSPGDLLFPPDGIRGWTYAYYRPVVVLSYMLDATLYGAGSTVGPHLSNLIFHVVTTWLVWLLAVRLFGHRSNGAIAAAFAASLPTEAETYGLTIVLSGDEEVRGLNRTWRGKDTPTNVLSFPAGAQPGAPRQLGDVVLAFETVAREADAQGLAVSDHVSHLVVHGVLHLLGFDHASEDEAEKMESTERRLLASLGIADPYAEKRHVSVAEVSS